MASPLGAFLSPPGYEGPCGLRAIARESSAVVEGARLAHRLVGDRFRPRRAPYGEAAEVRGEDPVVLVPGFMAGDSSLLLMSWHLRKAGYRTYRSTMHANVGCTRDASSALERRIEAIATKRQRKVSVVGHSLGGLLARGVAVRRPDLVEGIVTMGSPMLAPGAVHPLLAFDLAVVIALGRAGLGAMMGDDCTSGACARLSWEQLREELQPSVAFTSIFSRRDGVVDWRGCLDPGARTVEVRSSHLGMAIDPLVFDVVAATLRTHREDRRPSRAPQVTAAMSGTAPVASAG